MYRVSKLARQLEQCEVKLPLETGSEVFVRAGQKIKEGDRLYSTNSKQIKDSYYLPTLLGIKPHQSREHVGRVSGEYVGQGELLAEKLSAGGLVTKRVLAGTEGIISTQRIDRGYIDLLSEARNDEIASKFSGTVKDISPGKYIVFQCSALAFHYICDRGLDGVDRALDTDIVGELLFIGEGDSVYTTKDLDENYTGKIVFAGRYAYPELPEELYRRGAVAVLVYSMDYLEVANSASPVVLLGGFGQLSMSRLLLDSLKQHAGRMVKIEHQSRSIQILGVDSIVKAYSDNYFAPEVEIGERVRLLDPVNFHLVAEVIGKEGGEEYEYLVTLLESGERLLVHRDSVQLFQV